MRQFKYGSVLLMTMILVGCGGGSSDIPAKPKFSAHVSFGDSLSDVGTYNVGFIAQAGGGQFSINGPNANGKAANGNNITNWTEVLAMNLGLPAPCPAVTGLIGLGIEAASSVAVAPHLGCTGYAQGGALVTNPNGIHNAAYGTYAALSGLGGVELTYPVVQQINNYLTANGGNFSGTELVSVIVGGNEVKLQLTLLKAGATVAVPPLVPGQIAADIASGACVPADAQASNCVAPAVATLTAAYMNAHAPAAVGAMAQAATDLVNDVKTLMLDKKAKHVVVGSIPDFANIPALATYDAATKGLVDLMVSTYNSILQSGLAALPGSADVLFVDFYTLNKDQVANPAKYGLTNVTTQACDPVLTIQNRALFCNASTLKAGVGVTVDSHYLFSDDTHPTPYGHALFAQGVLQAMTAKGWY